jgi:hypothetical protein
LLKPERPKPLRPGREAPPARPPDPKALDREAATVEGARALERPENAAPGRFEAILALADVPAELPTLRGVALALLPRRPAEEPPKECH